MKIKYTTEMEMTRENLCKGLSDHLGHEINENFSDAELYSFLMQALSEIQDEECIKVSNVTIEN